MRINSVWMAIVAGIVCFAAGFVLANYLNRSELSALKGENESLKAERSANAQSSQQADLSDEEIDAKLSEAEQNASNFAFQKNLGLGLYRYGAIRQDKAIIEKALPVLLRANGLEKDDYDVIAGIGHAYYDIAYLGKNSASFERSREFYNKALVKRPKDIEIRTDLGATYFLQEPPDYQAAMAEFEKSLAIDPKHEKTLSFAALAMSKRNKDASKFTDELRRINPNNPTLRELASQQPQGSTNGQ